MSWLCARSSGSQAIQSQPFPETLPEKKPGCLCYRKKPAYHEEQFQLYTRYVKSRHPGGCMDEPEGDKYLEFLTSNWSDTFFFEFYTAEQLIGIAVTDLVENGFSAV